MASSSAVVKFTCVMLMCMVMVAPYAEAKITCSQVIKSLGPCTLYLTKGGRVPPSCCSGVKSLNHAAKTTLDRQTACKCLISVAGKIKGLKLNLAAGLPSSCGVNIPYKISPSTDCSKVQ